MKYWIVTLILFTLIAYASYKAPEFIARRMIAGVQIQDDIAHKQAYIDSREGSK